jgi:hypothetical protein
MLKFMFNYLTTLSANISSIYSGMSKLQLNVSLYKREPINSGETKLHFLVIEKEKSP